VDEIAFGASVRALRIRKRLTQQQLAMRAGLSRGVVARIEQGRASRVTVATLEQVATALGARVW
jgi:transcriptional regulator with XRE-family HTH domain